MPYDDFTSLDAREIGATSMKAINNYESFRIFKRSIIMSHLGFLST